MHHSYYFLQPPVLMLIKRNYIIYTALGGGEIPYLKTIDENSTQYVRVSFFLMFVHHYFMLNSCAGHLGVHVTVLSPT
jgi:hypothetical protein